MIVTPRYPRPSRRPRPPKRNGRHALIAGLGLLAVFGAAFLIGNPGSVLRLPRPAIADADAEIYTGTIQLPPTRGNLCRRMTFDNKTGELHDKGLGSCAESAANGGPPERYWRSNIEQVRKGFAGR